MRKYLLPMQTVLAILSMIVVLSILLWNFIAKPSDSNMVFAPNPDIPISLEEVNSHYNVKVKVDPREKSVVGSMDVHVRNDTGKDQQSIYFHLYTNQFRDDQKLTGQVWEYVLGKKRKPGWIDITSVHINGKESDYEIKDTIMEIPLKHWSPGEIVRINIDFRIHIPQNNSRISYDAHSVWLGNWLPIKAVYDDSGWNLDPYYPIGDPFYSDVANYDLEISVPKGYQVASSGIEHEQRVEHKNDESIYRVAVRNVRDFALVVMDDTYEVMEGNVGDTRVRTWYRSTDLNRAVKKLHELGLKSLDYYSKTYGEYLYTEYDLVRTGGFFGGMEYPGLVFLQGSYFEKDSTYGQIVVAHETAHQWWYGIVGNDEVEEPWLDESLTEYSTLKFFKHYYPTLGDRLLQLKEGALKETESFERKKEFVGNPVTGFSNWKSYGLLVYEKGPMMFNELEKKLGEDKMNQVLREYFEQYRLKNAKGEDLIRLYEEHYGEELSRVFEKWLGPR